MQTKIKAAPRLDSDQFSKMLESSAWKTYEARIQAELERARQSCERVPDTMELHRAQGSVIAYRVALAIPISLMEEMKQKK